MQLGTKTGDQLLYINLKCIFAVKITFYLRS